MNRPVLTFSVLAALLLGASAQPAAGQSFGVKGGANISTIAVTPPDGLGLDVSGKVGVVGGAFLTFHEASKLSFEVAGQLAMRRVAFGPLIVDTITYIEAPVVARYTLLSHPTMVVRGLAGGAIGLRLAARESVDGDSFTATDAYKPVDIAVVVGAQLEWNKRWLFEGRYQFGVSDAYDVTIGGLKTRQRGVQILVGYRLR